MKLPELKSYLQKENIDVAILYSLSSLNTDPNLFYFTGYNGLGALVVPKIKEPFLIAPKMEYEKARKSRIKKIYLWNKKRLPETIKEISNKNKIKARVIGIDYGTFTLSAFKAIKKSFKGAKFKNINKICSNLRIIKTNEEITLIRKGCKIADDIFKLCIENFKNFSTESEVASFLEYQVKKLGHDTAFKPIVASGKGSSVPHYEPKNIKLKKGFCVIDFGIRFNGYCTDMTRTLYIGKPKKREIGIYNLVLDVQKKAINSVARGVKCGRLYADVNKWLGEYKKNFIHGLGHGVGVEIHEAPNLKLDSKDVLDNNMVFTIEPGIYFPKKFGIRIEDTVVLVDWKIDVLTKSQKGLIVTNQNY